MERLIVTALLLIGLNWSAQAVEPRTEVERDRRELGLVYPIGYRNFTLFSQVPDGPCHAASHSFFWDVFMHFNGHSCHDVAQKLLPLGPGDSADFSHASFMQADSLNGICVFRKWNGWKSAEFSVPEPCPDLGWRILGTQY